MDAIALLLSRLQFAFTISFRIPALTIGLAAWLTILEALHPTTGRACVTFEFWLKIFGMAFGLGIIKPEEQA
jgi:cytochrome bd ubiquinol oxidase subunit I